MITLSLFLAFAMQSPSTEVVAHMQAGIAAEKLKQHDVAITEFRHAAQLQPDFTAAYVDLGMVYMSQHDYAQALAPLKQAISLDPGIAGAQEMLGYALLAEGYAAEAIPHLQLAGNPGMLGLAQLQSGDLAAAITQLEAGLAQHPNDPDLLSGLAQASGQLSRQAKDALLAADPDSAQGHQALAADYWALQKEAEAEGEYRKALAIDPKLPGAHLQLGQIYQSTQQWQKAEQEFAAEARLKPGSSEAAYRWGNALLQNGKMAEATSALRRSDALQPDMPETLFALGKAESLAGNMGAAEKDWNRLLAVEKDSDLAGKTHFALAGVYRKLGKRTDEAREMQAFQQWKAAAR